jgi:hypothetical protein
LRSSIIAFSPCKTPRLQRCIWPSPGALPIPTRRRMSYQATTWVMEFSESRLADRLVLGAISHRVSNDSGEAFPSVPTIAREANVSESTVYESLEKLKRIGELEWDRAASPYGSNVYRLPKFLAWMKSLHPRKSGGGRGSDVDKHPLQNPEQTPPKFGAKPSVNHHREPSEEKTLPASSPNASLHRRFVQWAKENFRKKHGGQAPAWTGRDYRQLSELLKTKNDLRIEEIQRRWMNFVDSSQPFIRDQGDSLRFFCLNFDRFVNGPLFASTTGGNRNGSQGTSIIEQEKRSHRMLAKAGFEVQD